MKVFVIIDGGFMVLWLLVVVVVGVVIIGGCGGCFGYYDVFGLGVFVVLIGFNFEFDFVIFVEFVEVWGVDCVVVCEYIGVVFCFDKVEVFFCVELFYFFSCYFKFFCFY